MSKLSRKCYRLLEPPAAIKRLEHVLFIVRGYGFENELFESDLVQMLEDLLAMQKAKSDAIVDGTEGGLCAAYSALKPETQYGE